MNEIPSPSPESAPEQEAITTANETPAETRTGDAPLNESLKSALSSLSLFSLAGGVLFILLGVLLLALALYFLTSHTTGVEGGITFSPIPGMINALILFAMGGLGVVTFMKRKQKSARKFFFGMGLFYLLFIPFFIVATMISVFYSLLFLIPAAVGLWYMTVLFHPEIKKYYRTL